MLNEFKTVRQDKNGFKRFFCSEKYDLYVWYDKEGGSIVGFQILYMKDADQKAFTWVKEEGYLHNTVDGWDSSYFNETPILVPDGVFCKNLVLSDIEKEMENIEKEIKEFVLKKLIEYPG